MTSTPLSPPPIQKHNKKQGPLSYSQDSLWFLQQLDPDNCAYNSTFIFKFSSGIVFSFMEQALNIVVQRHEPLRTIYPNQAGQPVQVVQPFIPFTLPHMDFSGLVEEEIQQAVFKHASELGNQPYDLQRGPLVRYAFIHCSSNGDYLIFGIHHIGFDGWSRQVLISELVQIYETLRSGRDPELPELVVQYTDYALWQKDWLRGQNLELFTEHWKDILSGELPVLDLHMDRPRPTIQTYQGARYHFSLPHTLLSQMRVFCQKERITLFHLLLAAYALLLMRHTGQEDVIIGCPFANRARPELDESIGMFVNTLPIRLDLSGNPTVLNLLDHVRSVMLDAFTWQAAPFERVVSEISPERDLSRTPVFQVVINMRNVPKRQSLIKGLEVETISREDPAAQFDISLDFDDNGDSLAASFIYNTDLFNENTIIHLAAHYQNLLREMVKKIESPIGELEMLTPSELKRIVFDWNNTNTDFPRDKTIHRLFEEQAAAIPNSPALDFMGKVLTFQELNDRSNQLAHVLQEMGVEPEVHVGLYVERSVEMIVALLAILKAGGAYVPLDPAYPQEQLSFILEDTASQILITSQNHSHKFPSFNGNVVFIDNLALYSGKSTEDLTTLMHSENLAYIMYTSGSKGLPKGCCIPHRAVVRLVKNTNYIDYNAKEVFLQFAPLAFDASTFEIWGSLLNGSKLVIFPPYLPNLDELARFVDSNGVTTLWLPSGLFHQAMESHPEIVNPLHQLVAGGDRLSARHVMMGMKLNSHCRFINGYGPTENTTFTCCYTINDLPDETSSIPIGRPISNSSVYILNGNRKPVPVGVIGELYTGGDGLSRGYLNQPELTDQMFVSNPFHGINGEKLFCTGDYARWLPDGNVEFVGRMDNQVKIRGFRVELGEIENSLKQHFGVLDAIVRAWEDQPGDKQLVGYVISSSEAAPDKPQLQEYLNSKIPSFMVPSTFVFMDAFPLTVNGKIDLKRLPHPGHELTVYQYLAPRNDIEARLVKIWQEVMGIEKVGIRDNFFELGGHSLMAVRLFTRIQDEFGLTLPLMLLFQSGTVETIANTIQGKNRNTDPEGILTIRPEGNGVPLFILGPGLIFRELVLALPQGRPVLGLNPVEHGSEIYRQSVQDTARIYYKNLIDFYPQGPYLLMGHSGYGFFALELARLLKNNGREVAFLGLLDSFPPGSQHLIEHPIDRVKGHLNNLKKKNFLGMLKYFRHSSYKFLNRVWNKLEGNAKRKERYEVLGQIKNIRNMIMKGYKLEPYDGNVTLFWAAEHPSFLRGDPLDLWRQYFIGGFNIVRVNGDHITMLYPPHVDALANKIEEMLPKTKNV